MLKNFKIFFALTFFYSTLIHGSEILIQSTTSTRDSGFYEFLLPKYPSYQNINIKVVAVGTGQAIKNAENCDADLLIVHDYQKEINFMKNNFGIRRDDLMYNDYMKNITNIYYTTLFLSAMRSYRDMLKKNKTYVTTDYYELKPE